MKFIRAIMLAGTSLTPLCAHAQAASPTPGNAAQANPGAEAQVDIAPDIIVEARRRDEDIQDVPLTVNAVTSETIAKLNLRSFQEITSVVPGLSLTANANGIGSSSSLRGVNQDVNVSGENGTVQFYFADAPVQSNFALQGLYDIGQIEVLRGPQGTLRGRSTPSGSITIAPRVPNLSEVGATMVGTLGNKKVGNLQFGINVPIIADKLAVRVAGLVDQNEGTQIRSLNSTQEPWSKTRSIRASVRAAPFDWLRGGFVFEALNVRSQLFDQVQSFSNLVPGFTPGIDQSFSTLPAGTFVGSGPFASPRLNNGTITLEDRVGVETQPRQVVQDFRYYSWNAAADFAGQSLIYVGSHLQSNFHPLTNQDPGATFPALTLFQDAFTPATNISHEVRLQNVERVAGIFDYVVGYFHQSAPSETILSAASSIRGYFPITNAQSPLIPVGVTSLTAVTGIIPTSTPIYIPPADTKEESFFGNLTVHLGTRTEIAGGLRRIHFTSVSPGLFIGCTPATYATGTCTASPGGGINYDVTKTIYNASIRHRFNEDLMIYAMSGSSARPPVRAVGDFSIAPTALEVSHIQLGTETSKSYEIGLKSDWFGKKLIFNLTAYHQNFKNYPYRAATGIYFVNVNSTGQAERSQFNFVSAVPVTVNGIESEITFAPSRLFRLSAVTNYSDSKIGKSQIACTDVNHDGVPDVAVPTLAQLQSAYGSEHIAECPVDGQSATFLPKLSGSVQGEATLPAGDHLEGYLRGLLNWRGKSSNDPTNPYDDVGAYGLVNAYVGLRDPKGLWEVSLYVKNMFDTTKLISAESSPANTSVTYVNLATSRPFGTASYQSYYSGVTVTPPREFGITARISLGSR